jgi:hypothetical protein
MAERAIALLRDPAKRRDVGRAAARVVRERFCADVIVPQYEAVYSSVLENIAPGQSRI